jgi:hypothetical protein
MPFGFFDMAKEHSHRCLGFSDIPAEHKNASLRDNLGLGLVARLRGGFPVLEFTS